MQLGHVPIYVPQTCSCVVLRVPRSLTRQLIYNQRSWHRMDPFSALFPARAFQRHAYLSQGATEQPAVLTPA